MKKIDISIIIVNYKSKNELFECLSSISKSNIEVTYEIIVVDNDEGKAVEENLKRKFKNVKYIKSQGNIGFGAGNNLGARYARGEYLFILNPDTIISPNSINELYKFINRNNKVGIVAPLLYDKNSKPYPLQGTKELTPFRAIFALSFINKLFFGSKIFRDYYLSDWNKKNIKEVDVAPGTAFVIRREIFEKLGGFDENFFLYFEEFDLCKRVKDSGWKIFISPRAKVFHSWAVSTSRSTDDIKKIFVQSRFYYLKKHFSFLSAIFAEVFLRTDKYIIFLTCTLLLGLFLRLFKLSETMSFIGDQGWFYLSARDMLLTGKIPLVGIASSHTWLHQGPYWTYILAVIFKIFGFNPLIPGYFVAFIGSFSILIVYKITKDLFEKKTAIIASFLYATSPIVLENDRFPYHTTLIPFFTLFFTYSLNKWVKGEVVYFAWAVIFLGMLYNFELATFSLGGGLILLLFFGFLRRKKWAINLINIKVILYTFFGFIFTMLPIIIYDVKHGFLQTFGFTAWIMYKIITIPNNFIAFRIENSANMIQYLLEKYRILIFAVNLQISLIFLVLSIIYFFYILIRRKSDVYIIIGILFFIILFGFLTAGSASSAYIPVFFPIIIIISAIFFKFLIEKVKIAGFMLISIFVLMNIYYFLNNETDSRNAEFSSRKEAVKKISEFSFDKLYNLIGKGNSSQFESFTMNYEYLLWYYYNSEPSDKDVNLKIYVEEKNNEILISKND